MRSVTETSMMFITPMPPTSSEIAAIPPSSTVSVRSTEVAAARMDCWLAMVKSAAAGVLTRCSASSVLVASWWAADNVCDDDASR